MFRESAPIAAELVTTSPPLSGVRCADAGRLGGAFETVVEATTSNQPPSGGRTYLVAGHQPLSALYGFRVAGCDLVQRAWGADSELGLGARRCRAPDSGLCLRSCGRGVERLGLGGQDAHQLSADVHGLLAAANVPGPYVLAGHSVGGVYALAYAMDYPKDVAGVALLDSSTPYQFDLSGYSTFYSVAHRASALLPPFARAGVVRVYIGCRAVRCHRMPVAKRRLSLPHPANCAPIATSSRSCQPSFARTRLLRVSTGSRSSF